MFNFDRYSQLFSNVNQSRRRRRAFLTSLLLHLLALLALLAFILFPRLQRPSESYIVLDVGTPALSSEFVNAAAADANAPSSDQVDVASEQLGVAQSAEAPEVAGAENPVQVAEQAAFEADTVTQTQEPVSLAEPLTQALTEPLPEAVSEVTAVPIEDAVVPDNVIEEAPEFSPNIEQVIDSPLEANQDAVSALIQASEAINSSETATEPLEPLPVATEISDSAAQQLIQLQESLLQQPEETQTQAEQANVTIGETSSEEAEVVDVALEEVLEVDTNQEANQEANTENTETPQDEEQTATAPDLSAGASASLEIPEQSEQLSAASRLNNLRDLFRNRNNEEFVPPRPEEVPEEVIETADVAPNTMFLATTPEEPNLDRPLEEAAQPLADIMNVQDVPLSQSAVGNPEVLAFSEDNNQDSNAENVEGDNLTGAANAPVETAPEGGTDSIARQTGEPNDDANPEALGLAAGPDGSLFPTGAPLPPEPFSMTKERPLSVMVDNVFGYPQNGLRETSTVFEMPVEGGLTRLMLIFDKDTPARVGPIRSARDYFLDISDGLGSVMVHVGGSPSALARIERNSTQTFDGLSSPLFARDSSRTAPYNTYSQGNDLRREMTRLGWNRVNNIRGLIYKPDDALPEVSSKTIRFSSQYSTGFRYVRNLASYQWVRNGVDAVDINGVSVKMDAVVLATSAASVIPGDSAGRLNVNTRSGLATLYIQGKAIDGQWSSRGGFSFISNDGEAIDLTPFKTWVTFIPPWASVN